MASSYVKRRHRRNPERAATADAVAAPSGPAQRRARPRAVSFVHGRSDGTPLRPAVARRMGGRRRRRERRGPWVGASSLRASADLRTRCGSCTSLGAARPGGNGRSGIRTRASGPYATRGSAGGRPVRDARRHPHHRSSPGVRTTGLSDTRLRARDRSGPGVHAVGVCAVGVCAVGVRAVGVRAMGIRPVGIRATCIRAAFDCAIAV
jgi:hypothetical protein